MAHTKEAPYLDDVPVEPCQVMVEPKAFGVKELEKIACDKILWFESVVALKEDDSRRALKYR